MVISSTPRGRAGRGPVPTSGTAWWLAPTKDLTPSKSATRAGEEMGERRPKPVLTIHLVLRSPLPDSWLTRGARPVRGHDSHPPDGTGVGICSRRPDGIASRPRDAKARTDSDPSVGNGRGRFVVSGLAVLFRSPPCSRSETATATAKPTRRSRITTSNDFHRSRRRAGRLHVEPGSPFRLTRASRPQPRARAHEGIVPALDVATSNNNGNSVSVLLGDGRGAFRPAPGSPFRVGRAPYPLDVADFNADGKPDIATPDVNGDTVTVLLGNGRGAFAPGPGSPYRVDGRPYRAGGSRERRTLARPLHQPRQHLTVTILLRDGEAGFGTADSRRRADGSCGRRLRGDLDRPRQGLATRNPRDFFGDGAATSSARRLDIQLGARAVQSRGAI